MKTRRRETMKLKHREKPTGARGLGCSASDLQEQLDRRTRELSEAREQQAATSEIFALSRARRRTSSRHLMPLRRVPRDYVMRYVLSFALMDNSFI